MRIYLLITFLPLVSCSLSPKVSETNFAKTVKPSQLVDYPKVPNDFSSRLDTLEKGKSKRIGRVLSRLGLWKYRHKVSSQRRSNVLHLKFEDKSGITFIADTCQQGIQRDLEQRPRSEWDLYIHELDVLRVEYKGIWTDISKANNSCHTTSYKAL